MSVYILNDKGHQKKKKLGNIREIPNIHLAQTFISTCAKHKKEDSTREAEWQLLEDDGIIIEKGKHKLP